MLKDEKTLDSYGIEDGFTIYAMKKCPEPEPIGMMIYIELKNYVYTVNICVFLSAIFPGNFQFDKGSVLGEILKELQTVVSKFPNYIMNITNAIDKITCKTDKNRRM